MGIRKSCDTVVIGGGLSGIAAAGELISANQKVLLLDRDLESRWGGMAKDSFGGITMVGTPQQKKAGIRDSAELALSDWLSCAEFEPEDLWPRKWAEYYVESSLENIFGWLTSKGIKFFPVVHWVERGLFRPGNSVPRFHMVWGTGQGLVESVVGRLNAHPRRANLETLFQTTVNELTTSGGRVTGCRGRTAAGEDVEIEAGNTVIAAGGICGDLDLLKKHWHKPWGEPPAVILNGSHRYADGKLHAAAEKIGARITHLDLQWNYAAGVHHPRPEKGKKDPGISLVPPRSALWVDAEGRRIGPIPLITSFDTRFLVEQVCKQEKKYSWQILNRKIALKELAVSGSEFNPAIRDKRFFKFLMTILFGNKELVDDLTTNCIDFVQAPTLEELVRKMNALQGDESVRLETLRAEVERWDGMIARGPKYFDDDQLRRIMHLRQYRGDKVRTCKFQRILDPAAGPLIAIREFILSRKSLGGLQTDLKSRVLDVRGEPIAGLYAVGEAAGFGGGGNHGRGALEGTFLGSCIVTGQAAAWAIAGKGNA